MEKITETAYAKINLGLDVLGKRADGYHEVSMVMQSISLADTVTLEKHSGLVVQTGRSDLPGDSSNLAYKAAVLMAERFNKTPDVKITLDKHIFMADGPGGRSRDGAARAGSSDAAAVLRGLNRLWQLGLNAVQLEQLAAEIGSDVPFCICGGTALAEGRGEILTPLPEPQEAVIVLAKPQQAVSTAWVYKEFDSLKEPQHPDIGTLKAALLKGNAVLPLPGMGNALEGVTCARYPEINKIKKEMFAAGAQYALMSGSGPTVFAVAGSTQEAQKIIEALQAWKLETAIATTVKRSVI